MRIGEIVYFEEPGPQNTMETLQVAYRRMTELGLKDVVVASTTGETGVKASRIFRDLNLIIVTHQTGFQKPGLQEFNPENLREIGDKARILTCTHSLSGVERAMRRSWNTVGPVELMANALKIFGEGVKVCIEIAVMAADAGLIPVDKDVVSIGGTGNGADTALILRPANSPDFFNLEVKEILAKPVKR
ncbi:MAG: pyruvate kinase alpha/beta domain-containing protein [Candidatus Bathyarchaeia archaeon]